MSNFRFAKDKRLMYASEFKQVFDVNKNQNQTSRQDAQPSSSNGETQGFRFANAYFSIIAIENNQATARLGLVVAKKNLKFAHDRNRFKRLTREYFRLNLSQGIAKLDYVVMARPSFMQIANDGTRVMQEYANAFAYIARKYNNSKVNTNK